MQSAEGVIVKGVGGLYYARGEDGGTHVLRARGIFRRRHITPMVGDRVRFTPGQGEEHGWVEEILPRESQLVRPPVANVRYLVIVLAPAPAPDYLLIDTLIAMALRQDIRPALVVNKCDLDGGTYEAVRSDYAGLGAPLLAVRALSGQGMDGLQSLLASGVCCLAGQSGVGKSTLLCAATGLRLQTGEISQKIHRGRHTTRHAELLFSGEYRVLDTPGFSLLELWEGLEPIRLKEYYPEFAPYEGQCRFSPCYHLSEPGCAVLKAARAGEISQARLERYHLLLKKAQ
ncbi:MAG: ribosome small subunit-dependent GTPase A [Christensenellaceae bacterium]|nr:ribosome small subunit-dependent GTPase A [Christensenellaceae bacterium]